MVTPIPLWGFIEMLAVILLCFSGVHVAAAMGIVGLGFAWLYYGSLASGIGLTGIGAWEQGYSYHLTMIPLFVWMGTIIGQCQIGGEAFDCFYKWLAKLRGSLAIISTVTCSVFGAITGSTAATIATIGGISLPEMMRRGYTVELRTGAIAAAGMLANLIPPSIIAIIYCTLVEESVGRVFIAGIIPGIILTILFCLVIYIWVSLRPNIAPPSVETFSFKEKVVSLKGVVPIFVVFILLIGGIYTGYFSPTEAAGIGTVYAIALTLILRRLTWQRFKDATVEALRITAFIMLILMGAVVFGDTIAVSRLPDFIAEAVIGLGIPPTAMMFSIIAVFIALGCVMDSMSLMVLFVPLFLPCIVALGFDTVWYGTLSVVLIEVAMITPPVAINIWVTQGIDPEATVMDVTRGVWPFYSCTAILLVLLVFFPQIATWLPNTMMG